MDSDSEVSSDLFSESLGSSSGDDITEEEVGEVGGVRAMQPYMYEPERGSDSDSDNDVPPAVRDDDDDVENRLGNSQWCLCGCCVAMPTVKESICCKEVERVVAKMDEFVLDVDCITEHPGFSAVCLNLWVLETALWEYNQAYNPPEQEVTQNQKNRHAAYRQLVRWIWHFLGKEVRVPLPSCAVNRIRQAFPSDVYKGFKEIE
ncbi:uncharacterized protein LOC117305813 [Asterias rubens]|uniref:uncharacterized protein LOC117305813 n=1 Tax=Asterias rubens TaxID=7604 RepID=UPI001455589D|nr:uncharacterized protein LOC117305813 [Asterias rubens]